MLVKESDTCSWSSKDIMMHLVLIKWDVYIRFKESWKLLEISTIFSECSNFEFIVLGHFCCDLQHNWKTCKIADTLAYAAVLIWLHITNRRESVVKIPACPLCTAYRRGTYLQDFKIWLSAHLRQVDFASGK